MNVLWERYVGRLFRRAAPQTCEVVEQEPWTFWQDRPAAPRRVHPDAILRERRTGRNLVAIDAKWKIIGSAGPADDDLKQMFVYNHLLGTRQALLVYPCVDAGWSALDGRYVGCDHRCGSLAIGLFEGDGWNTRLLVAQVERALIALSVVLEAQAGSASAEAS